MRIPLTPLFALSALISTASCAAPVSDGTANAVKSTDAAKQSSAVKPVKAGQDQSVLFAADTNVITEKSRIDEAFEGAFDVPAVTGKESVAKVILDEETFTFKPVALYRLRDNEWVLLSAGQSDNEGHVATGRNGLHYLDPAEGGWQSTAKWFGLGSTGTWGNAATDWMFTRSLGKNPFLLTSAGCTWQGCTVTTTTITELTPTGPVDRGDFIDHNSWGDSPSGNNFDYEGTIISAVPDKSFTVRYKGTKTADVTFAREGDKYVAKGKVPAEGC